MAYAHCIVCSAFCDKVLFSLGQHPETRKERDILHGHGSWERFSSRETPQQGTTPGGALVARDCVGRGRVGKVLVDGRQALNWRRHMFLLFVGCIALLAWYIPRRFPEWHLHVAAVLWENLFLVSILLVALLFSLLRWLLWKLPKRQVEGICDEKDRLTAESGFRQPLIQIVQTLGQIVGGAALLGGLYYTAQTLRTSQETLRVNQKTLETTQQGQITERFSKAIEQLGSDNLAIRLGGIYALERIARDSAYDHWTVMEVLTAYIRENAPWPPKPPKDIQPQQDNPLSKEEPSAAQKKQGMFNGAVSSIGGQQIAEDFILSHDATIKAIAWTGALIDVDPSSVPSSIEFIVRFFQDEGVPPHQPLQLNHRPMPLPFFETTITATVSYSGLSGFADPGHPNSAQIFLLKSSGNLATPVPLQGGQVYWISLLEKRSPPLVYWASGESGPSVFRLGGGSGGDGSAWYETSGGANGLGFAFTLFDKLIEQKGDPLSKKEPPKGTSPAAQSRLLPKLPKQDTAIQAVLTVLGRRTLTYETREDQVLDLQETDLRLADLAGAHLTKVNLDRAHLERAQLPRANLERAHLWRANLERANLHGAHLERANLVEAHLEVTNLVEAHLGGGSSGSPVSWGDPRESPFGEG